MFAKRLIESVKTKYYTKSYKSTHWALHIPTIADKNFIATLKINRVRIGLKLNQSDARGYRGIACLVAEDEAQLPSTFNRDYSIEEKLALTTALGIFASAYEKYGIIAQISIAGNNSQSVNPDGSVQIGNEKEPSLLHGHVIGRGNPEMAYIGNVTLKGPKAGFEMNLRGDGSDEGNVGKENWKDDEMAVVADGLATAIGQILQSSPELKKIEVVSIRETGALKNSTQTSNYKILAGVGGAAALALFGLFMGHSRSSESALDLLPKSKL